jgi:broad specificity phosphatase PhoE
VKPQQFFIFRHGESAANLDQSLRANTPDHRIELTPQGVAQSRLLGHRLEPLIRPQLAVWTSPYARARQTTAHVLEGLAHFDPFVREDPRIREQDWGNYCSASEHGTHFAALEAHSRFFYRVSDGEAGADVFDRVSSFLEMVFRDNTAQTILISTHGLTALIFMMRLLNWRHEDYEQTAWFHNTGFVRLELQTSGEYELVLDARQVAPEVSTS